MFSYGKDKQTARVAGEFYINAINVMRGAEALSTYSPIPERKVNGGLYTGIPANGPWANVPVVPEPNALYENLKSRFL